MKESDCKRYEDPPLFLNAATVAKLLGVSQSNCYELMHEPDFPVLKIGNRMVIPKEQFTRWGMGMPGGGKSGTEVEPISLCPTRSSCWV